MRNSNISTCVSSKWWNFQTNLLKVFARINTYIPNTQYIACPIYSLWGGQNQETVEIKRRWPVYILWEYGHISTAVLDCQMLICIHFGESTIIAVVLNTFFWQDRVSGSRFRLLIHEEANTCKRNHCYKESCWPFWTISKTVHFLQFSCSWCFKMRSSGQGYFVSSKSGWRPSFILCNGVAYVDVIWI